MCVCEYGWWVATSYFSKEAPGPKLPSAPSATYTPTSPAAQSSVTVQLTASDVVVLASSTASAKVAVPPWTKRQRRESRRKLAPETTTGVPCATGPLDGATEETTASAVKLNSSCDGVSCAPCMLSRTAALARGSTSADVSRSAQTKRAGRAPSAPRPSLHDGFGAQPGITRWEKRVRSPEYMESTPARQRTSSRDQMSRGSPAPSTRERRVCPPRRTSRTSGGSVSLRETERPSVSTAPPPPNPPSGSGP